MAPNRKVAVTPCRATSLQKLSIEKRGGSTARAPAIMVV